MYSALYLSDDPEAENHEYAYASQLKLMGAINAGSLDVVLMNGKPIISCLRADLFWNCRIC